MEPYRLDVHGIYGSICKEGEFVHRGDILGLNVEGNGVVVAPISGWIRLPHTSTRQEQERPLVAVEIWPDALSDAAPSHSASETQAKVRLIPFPLLKRFLYSPEYI